MRYFSTIILIFCVLACFLMLAGCSNTKYLTGDQLLLKKNRIEIKQSIHPLSIKEDIHLKKDLEYSSQLSQALLGLCKQKPNRKTFNIFKVNLYLYNKGQRQKDTTDFFPVRWYNNLKLSLGKHFGEP